MFWKFYRFCVNYYVLQKLLKGDDILDSAMLGVSILTATYCEEKSQCQYLPEVSGIVQKYEEMLGVNCFAANKTEKDKMVLTLKGFLNFNHAEDNFAISSPFSFSHNFRSPKYWTLTFKRNFD